jgi:hypothetical protein
MARRRLTDEEREIRRSAGIPFARWWPVPVVFVALVFAAMNSLIVETCLRDVPNLRFGPAALARMATAGVCSPVLLRGQPADWLLFVCIWAPIPFAIRNWFWGKRHRAYWHRIRARENERRAERRAQKATRQDESMKG